MSGLAEFVATLLDDLCEVAPSTGRSGQLNWLKLGSRDCCWRCGGRFGGELEPGSQVYHHIIPTSEGGTDSPDNKSLLCSNCHAVIHRFYLPTSKIGSRRTRQHSSRRVGDFKGGVKIYKELPSADHRTGHCSKCGTPGTVVGVSEGYWNGEGLIVFLDCQKCTHKFAEPFIGTGELPAVDPISAISLAITSGFNRTSDKVPRELATKIEAFHQNITSILSECRTEVRSTERNARRAGSSDVEINSKLRVVREKYGKQLEALMSQAINLEKESKAYIEQ